MSNRCYLVGSRERLIYPSFVYAQTFKPKEDTYLASSGCIPLAWLLLFRTQDFLTRTFEPPQGVAVTVTAPAVSRGEALERFAARRAWVSELFAANGGLDFHLGVFLEHLEKGDHDFLTMEIEEIEGLHAEGEVQRRLTACLDALDARNPAAKGELVELSTVMADRHFFSPAEAEAGGATKEDMWNFYRILGESWGRRADWD